MNHSEVASAAVRMERVVELASRFCAIPSSHHNEGALGEEIATLLEAVPGVEVDIEDVVPGRPNVIAVVRGEDRRPPLVLNGHLDAPLHPRGWSHDPFDPWIEGNRLFGAGIADMKGTVGAMVAAVEAAASARPLPGDLVLQAVMHHDGKGLGTKYALATGGPRAGYAICGEPSASAIHTANAGSFKFEVVLSGRAAHVSAMDEAANVLPVAVELHRRLSSHEFGFIPHPRLPDLPRTLVAQLDAGVSPGIVADRAVLTGDVRTVPGMTRASVREEIATLAGLVVPDGVRARVRITDEHQPFLGATEGALVDAIVEAHGAICGAPPRITNELPGQAFVTDAADLVAAGLETVVYGAANWRYAPDEYVEIDALVASARVYLAVALSPGLVTAPP